jgi:hypothetical protein
MTVIEVLRPVHRWYVEPKRKPQWRRWNGCPPADQATQEGWVEVLRGVWPLWQFRVVLLLEDG